MGPDGGGDDADAIFNQQKFVQPGPGRKADGAICGGRGKLTAEGLYGEGTGN